MIVEATRELIEKMLRTGNELHVRIEDGIPEGYELKNAYLSTRATLVLTFTPPHAEHPLDAERGVRKNITVRDFPCRRVDYRALLGKYIEHVMAAEGTDFISDAYLYEGAKLAEDEWSELERLSRERADARRERLEFGGVGQDVPVSPKDEPVRS